jgi:hypothetical protein
MLRYRPRSKFATAITIATAAVLIGLADLPHDYFVLLRFVLSGVSAILLYEARIRLRDWQRWLLVGALVLHNPVLPIALGEKALWMLLNLGTVFLFWTVEWRYGSPFPQVSVPTPTPITQPTRTEPPPPPVISSKWSCYQCSHRWEVAGRDWAGACPSCKEHRIRRDGVYSDGRDITYGQQTNRP